MKIDPKAVDPDDVETLEDLVLAALHNATEAAEQLTEEKMGPLAGGLGGMGLPGLLAHRCVRRRYPRSDRRARPAARRRAEERAAHRVPRARRPTRPTSSGSPPRCTRVKEQVRFCAICFNVAEAEQCRICRDPRRSDEVFCVVEEPKDVVAIERTGEFRGRYHVLGGAINPLEGIGPDNLRIRELMTRLGGRRRQGADPRHRPEHRGRGDRDLPGAAGQADGASP